MRWGVTATPLDWKNNPPNPPCQGGFFNNPLKGGVIRTFSAIRRMETLTNSGFTHQTGIYAPLNSIKSSRRELNIWRSCEPSSCALSHCSAFDLRTTTSPAPTSRSPARASCNASPGTSAYLPGDTLGHHLNRDGRRPLLPVGAVQAVGELHRELVVSRSELDGGFRLPLAVV